MTVALALYAVILLNAVSDMIEKGALKREDRNERAAAVRWLKASLVAATLATVLLLTTIALDVTGVWS